MPRPGARPYECVRRAWHSERHQPMRGSLIKEIFRIAHEIHRPQTKKNKEWQEKLPIVVLKAEEIMYSKANSEAEYNDPKTLWERVNDAIDTIIRREESTETGELLQPCIEAALKIGCIPRRASRSQINSDPRFYLGPYSLERSDGTLKPTSPVSSQYPNFSNPTMLSSNSYSVYPLYHGTYPPLESQPGSNDKKIMEMGILQNASQCDKESSTTITEDQPEELVCDLSLRLAPLSVSSPWTNSAAYNLTPEPEDDAGSKISSKEDTKLNDFAVGKQHKELPLCPWANSAPILGLSSDMSDSQARYLNVDSVTRKRRAEKSADNQRFSWQPKLLCTYSAGSA